MGKNETGLLVSNEDVGIAWCWAPAVAAVIVAITLHCDMTEASQGTRRQGNQIASLVRRGNREQWGLWQTGEPLPVQRRQQLLCLSHGLLRTQHKNVEQSLPDLFQKHWGA